MNPSVIPDNSKKNQHQFIFWLLIALLLLLRIPLLGWATYLVPTSITWIEPLYEIGTYVIIVFLIWWERDNLLIHHMDGLAIFIILIFKPLSLIILRKWTPNSPIAFPNLLSLIFFIAAIFLAILILRKKFEIKIETRRTIFWLIIGGLIGICIMTLEGFIMIKYFNSPFPRNPGSEAWVYPIYQFGFAAVPEEPLFRGFLWGGLKKAGLKDLWILIIQALLFTIAHIYYLNNSQAIIFLVLIFINSLFMGIIVWKSRLLSSSIAFHGFANGSHLVQFWVYTMLFK